jgi:hypothetical protein
VIGLVVAAVLLFLRATFLVLRPRRRQP